MILILHFLPCYKINININFYLFIMGFMYTFVFMDYDLTD